MTSKEAANDGVTSKKAKLDETLESSVASRQQAPSAATTASSSSGCAPLYGSKDYWESRYARQFGALSDELQETSPYHAWYFTYEQLRPLILPLIFGGPAPSSQQVDGDQNDDDNDDDELDSEGVDPTTEEQPVSKSDQCIAGVPNMSPPTSNDCDNGADVAYERISEHKSNGEPGRSDAERDDDDVDDDDDASAECDNDNERGGLAAHGPINVMEIGCGDVPLGVGLALELLQLQRATQAPARTIVQRIVCTDFSQVVVDAMNLQYSHTPPDHAGMAQDDSRQPAWTNIGDLPLTFQVADARHLPFDNDSIELILEKGTLDAVLSDTQSGVANCVAIVAECARVVTVGGFMVLVSHLNAHTLRGTGWLRDVVLEGLRTGGQDDNEWVIEVHGHDKVLDDDDDDDAAPGPPSGSSGPAVYIIHKSKQHIEGQHDDTENGDKSQKQQSTATTATVSVKYFAY